MGKRKNACSVQYGKSEVTYYNNIREFLIDRKIQNLDSREEGGKIILMLKAWMLEQGYALSSKKYRPAYDKSRN